MAETATVAFRAQAYLWSSLKYGLSMLSVEESVDGRRAAGSGFEALEALGETFSLLSDECLELLATAAAAMVVGVLATAG